MKVNSVHINNVVQIVNKSNNQVLEISEGWSRMKQVVHMAKKLSASEREEIAKKEPSLRHWVTTGSPHNAPEEGYTCDESMVSIAFPK